MLYKKIKLLILLSFTMVFAGGLYAKEYTNTSYYVAYDKDDKTQFALVMPSVNKVYTHKAGKIESSDLSRVDTQFTTFPTYDNGELCFSALNEDASGESGASVMAGNCYDVNFFYTQKEVAPSGGMAFILTYTPTDTVYEGLAGDASSFKVVKKGDTVQNVNSVTRDNYSLFRFDIYANKVVMGEVSYVLVANEVRLQTNSDVSIMGRFNSTGEHLKYFIMSQPAQGTLITDEDTQTFTYTPKAGFLGTDTFTYKAYDGQAYSNESEVSIEVVTPTVNTGDTTAPTPVTILSISSPSSNKITLFWLGSTDNVTSTDELLYEVHCSTQKDFTPDASTKKYAGKGALEADISALQEDTLYYVKVKTLDAGSNEVVSSEMNITTSTPDAVLLNTANIVKQADDLFLHDAVISETNITYPKTDKSIAPTVGDILVGDSSSRTLKKVTGVETKDGNIVVQTESVAMSEVFSSLKLDTKTVLYDPNKITTQTSRKLALKKFKRYSYNAPTVKGYEWGSGKFKIEQPALSALQKKRPSLLRKLRKRIGTTGSYVTISSSADDKITVTSGEALSIDVLASLNTGSDTGFDEDDKSKQIESFELVTVTHDGVTDYNNFGFSMSSKQLGITEQKGTVRFIATDSRASTKPYILKLKAKAKWYDVTGIDTWEDSSEEVEIEVTVLTKKIDSTEGFRLTLEDDGKYTNYSFPILPDFKLKNKVEHNYKVKATAGVNIDFAPTLVTELDIDESYVKVLLGGKMTFELDSSFDISGELTKTYDFNLTALDKKFINVYAAGPVPVYQEIDITWKMQIIPTAKGSINVSNKMTKVFNVNFGIECTSQGCEDLRSNDSSSSYIAKVDVGAEASLEVRLIPEVKISFYKAASAALTVEPWVKAGVAAEGSAEFVSDFTNYESWLSYSLNDLNATVGLDSYVYADLKVFKWELYRYPEKGKQRLFGVQADIFSLPTLGVENVEDNDLIKDKSISIQAQVEDGIRTNVDKSSIQWLVYPSYGATITKDEGDPLKANLTFSEFGIYKIYFVANSAQLKSAFGQQRAEITIDARDTDGDLMADKWEEANGFNPVDGSEGKADKDGDGYSNLLEYQAGTNPEDSTSYPDEKIDINTTVPVITLLGDNPMTVIQGDVFTDPGATASDETDGNITASIVVSTSAIDTSIIGTHMIDYSVTNSAGNEVNATRIVYVVEAGNVPPTAIATATPSATTYGEVITFDASESSDSDGRVVSYSWKEGEVLLSTDVSFSEENLSVGTHTITLMVTDDDNATGTDSLTVTIRSSSSISTQLKKTGQTKSYNENGDEVTDSSVKDDGFYQTGVTPSYTRDDSKEIVTDHITGLEWADDANASSVTKQWVTDENYDDGNYSDTSGDTATMYCTDLRLGGHGDWRLPTRKELVGIADYGRDHPSIDPVFENVASRHYWSSTTYAGNSSVAWYVNFYDGYRSYYNKDVSFYVRCVRAGQ